MAKTAVKTKKNIRKTLAKTTAATKKNPAVKVKVTLKRSVHDKLLSKGEPAPFRVENPKGKGVGFIICDHASHRVPKTLQKNFGVSQEDMLKHVGWDIGAEEASLRISKKLDMPLITAQYSRLVVDLNRDPEYFECMPEESDHIAIPANKKISAKERKQRLDEIFWPYQNRVGDEVDRFLGEGRVPFILAIHSFTPEMDGFERPWHIGVLWNKEEKIAKTFIHTLRELHPEYVIGENEPYSLKDERFEGSTIWRHAEARGIPYIFIEFRQDLIDTPRKAAKWADIFLAALKPVLQDKETFRMRRLKK